MVLSEINWIVKKKNIEKPFKIFYYLMCVYACVKYSCVLYVSMRT